jgi:uncharacterized membrane protein YheB (UPF0754 family)
MSDSLYVMAHLVLLHNAIFIIALESPFQVDSYAGASLPIVYATIGADQHELLKRDIVARVLSKTPTILERLEAYTEEALDMENLLREKMSALSSAEFEGMLHPVFEEDEIILIVMGAFLGIIIGAGQQFLIGG